MTVIRLAGVQGNKTQMLQFVQDLQSPPPSYVDTHRNTAGQVTKTFPRHWEGVDDQFRFTLMHTLAQIGAVGAVPEMDNLIQTSKNVWIVDYAKVSKARLLAESGTLTKPGAATPAQLNRKITRFLAEMGYTAADLNAGAGEAEAAHREFLAHPYSDGGGYTPLGLLAMREVADICYRDGTVSPASVSALKGIEFNRDAPSALKMRLAPLPRPQRVDALIQELSTDKIDLYDKQIQGAYIQQYKEQLLCDEDIVAKKALAAVLLPRVASANGAQAAASNADVAAAFDKAHGTSGGGMELVNIYNNIAGDGSVPLVLSGGWLSDMTATHILRRQFVTEY